MNQRIEAGFPFYSFLKIKMKEIMPLAEAGKKGRNSNNPANARRKHIPDRLSFV